MVKIIFPYGYRDDIEYFAIPKEEMINFMEGKIVIDMLDKKPKVPNNLPKHMQINYCNEDEVTLRDYAEAIVDRM